MVKREGIRPKSRNPTPLPGLLNFVQGIRPILTTSWNVLHADIRSSNLINTVKGGVGVYAEEISEGEMWEGRGARWSLSLFFTAQQAHNHWHSDSVHTWKFYVREFHLKYLRPVTTRNFSMKSSESSTAMCAARPINEFAVLGSAWCTS